MMMMMRRMPTNSLQVLFALLCIITKLSSGFNVAPSTTTALTSITRWQQQQQQHVLPKKSHTTNNCSLRLQAHSSSCRNINYSHHRRGSSNNNNSGGVLFPQRDQNHHHHRSLKQITSLQMSDDTNNNSNNNGVSENQNLLVRIWSKLRTFVAKLWSVLLKPFQILKSILTKKTGGGSDDDTVVKTTVKDEVDEPIQEEVAITQLDNLAADERVVDETFSTANNNNGDDSATVGVNVEQEKEEEKVVTANEVIETSAPTKAITTTTSSTQQQQRQATATVDFTGNWTLIVDDTFKSEYDSYLRKLGQPMLVRTLAEAVIGSTKEEVIQNDEGKELYIRGMNVRGSWERTLEASEMDVGNDVVVEEEEEGGSTTVHAVEGHVLKPMTTADEEEVEVASWWEDGGKVHRSWVVGGKKYGGGDFENKRYLSDNGNILVCESTFHPNEEGREDAIVTWRFLREGAIYGDAGFAIPNIFDVLKKDTDENEDDMPEEFVVVGDIMDSVTSSEEADGIMSSGDDVISNSIEEAIDRAGWVPPAGERWAIASPEVDISGKWKLIITEQFKEEYDEFLKSLGQPLIVRGAALLIVGNTREETKQSDGGREVYIRGVNAKGVWERTLISSGSDFDTTLSPNEDGTYNHVPVQILTADSEKVDATSWWENDGTVHVSVTQTGRYGGGNFESRRYLENNGDVYVCESIFRRDNSADGPDPQLKWKFLREGATFFVGSSK